MGMSIVYTSSGVERVTELTPWLEKDGAKRGVIYTADPFTEDDWRHYSVEKVLIMDEIYYLEVDDIKNAQALIDLSIQSRIQLIAAKSGLPKHVGIRITISGEEAQDIEKTERNLRSQQGVLCIMADD